MVIYPLYGGADMKTNDEKQRRNTQSNRTNYTRRNRSLLSDQRLDNGEVDQAIPEIENVSPEIENVLSEIEKASPEIKKVMRDDLRSSDHQNNRIQTLLNISIFCSSVLSVIALSLYCNWLKIDFQSDTILTANLDAYSSDFDLKYPRVVTLEGDQNTRGSLSEADDVIRGQVETSQVKTSQVSIGHVKQVLGHAVVNLLDIEGKGICPSVMISSSATLSLSSCAQGARMVELGKILGHSENDRVRIVHQSISPSRLFTVSILSRPVNVPAVVWPLINDHMNQEIYSDHTSALFGLHIVTQLNEPRLGESIHHVGYERLITFPKTPDQRMNRRLSRVSRTLKTTFTTHMLNEKLQTEIHTAGLRDGLILTQTSSVLGFLTPKGMLTMNDRELRAWASNEIKRVQRMLRDSSQADLIFAAR